MVQFNPNFQRTHRERAIPGFKGIRINGQSRFLPHHKLRMANHIRHIHAATGPLAGCSCTICLQYRKIARCGKYHIKHGHCHCPYCELLREQRRAVKELELTGRRAKKKAASKEARKAYHKAYMAHWRVFHREEINAKARVKWAQKKAQGEAG